MATLGVRAVQTNQTVVIPQAKDTGTQRDPVVLHLLERIKHLEDAKVDQRSKGRSRDSKRSCPKRNSRKIDPLLKILIIVWCIVVPAQKRKVDEGRIPIVQVLKKGGIPGKHVLRGEVLVRKEVPARSKIAVVKGRGSLAEKEKLESRRIKMRRK
ncbi:hypothetical protein SESBI_29270 [Sesbania bispinosa]|nr:hypothetical protein SESBI_29270 [Sesbania bispinosa]